MRAADEIGVAFRDATAGNGDYSVIAVTAALSLTIPATATLGFANGAPGRIWITAVNNAGTVSLAAINCFTTAGRDISAGGLGHRQRHGNDHKRRPPQTFYGPATLSAVPYTLLGYASYETGSTLATAGIWSAKPTRLELLRPGVPLPGAVVQSLYSLNTAASTGANSYTPSATVPTTAGGNLVTSQAITPTSSANILRIKGEAMLGTTSVANASLTAFLTQDAANQRGRDRRHDDVIRDDLADEGLPALSGAGRDADRNDLQAVGHRRRRRDSQHQHGRRRQRVLRRHRQLLPPRRGDHGVSDA